MSGVVSRGTSEVVSGVRRLALCLVAWPVAVLAEPAPTADAPAVPSETRSAEAPSAETRARDTLDTRLAAARARLERAAAALTAVEQGDRRARLAALAEAVRAHEAGLAAYREGLRRLAVEDRRLTGALTAEHARLRDTLAALQTLSRAPASALLAYPGGPLQAARAARLMAAVTPRLRGEVERLSRRLDTLRRLRVGQEIARAEAQATLAALQSLRAESSRRRTAAAPRADRERLRAQAAEAARRAGDLSDLARILESARSLAPPRSFEARRGDLAAPIAGRLVEGFGGTDPWGRPSRGLVFEAPAYARVFAPVDGTVRYAGPLIDHGNVVILEPEEGWLMVFAGLGHVGRAVGETVLAGETLGDLGGPLPESAEFLRQRDGAEGGPAPAVVTELLYVELRRAERAVDPGPWFADTGK